MEKRRGQSKTKTQSKKNAIGDKYDETFHVEARSCAETTNNQQKRGVNENTLSAKKGKSRAEKKGVPETHRGDQSRRRIAVNDEQHDTDRAQLTLHDNLHGERINT